MNKQGIWERLQGCYLTVVFKVDAYSVPLSKYLNGSAVYVSKIKVERVQ